MRGWSKGVSRRPLMERFNEKWTPEPFSGCWIWIAGRTGGSEYGAFKLGEKHMYSHRASWEIHRGPIPTGLLVLHKCDVPCCVNPNHLFLGTHQDNSDDCAKKDRLCRGEGQRDAKLNAESVRLIRSSNLSQRKVAKLLQVHRSTVQRVRSGNFWRHIP